MNVKMIVGKAEKRFDFIVMNGPCLTGSPDWRQIISTAQAAFIFFKAEQELGKFVELIKDGGCEIISNIQMPESEPQ